jgi:hypothetical protein
MRLQHGTSNIYGYGGDLNQNLVTFKRTWLRPRAFEMIEERNKRERLLELFPDGAYVAFAGDIYCESRNESMDDHWRVMVGLPGEGQNRQAIGSSLIPIQEQVNDLTNIEFESYEFGIPPIYVDSEAIDLEALRLQTTLPGSHVPVQPRPGQSVAQAVFAPPPAVVSPQMQQYRTELFGRVAQFLTGAFPALFGGELGKTAAEYAMAREQALGRIGLIWKQLQYFFADVDLASVEVFRKNRTRDVEVPVFGEGKEFTSDWIHLADLKGNMVAFPEVDADYPVLESQQRALLLRLLDNPQMLGLWLGSPDNQETFHRLLGLTDFIMPGEGSRIKQYREIEQLLREEPSQGEALHHTVQGEGQPGPDGQPAQPVLLPSIVPDEFADNHAVELEVCRAWMNSEAGQAAKIENPAGFANVRAHAMAHEQLMKMKTLQQAMAAKAAAVGLGPAPLGQPGG